MNLTQWNEIAIQHLEEGNNDMFIETLKKVVNQEFPKREFETEANKYIKQYISQNKAPKKTTRKKNKIQQIQSHNILTNQIELISMKVQVLPLRAFYFILIPISRNLSNFLKSEYFSQSQEFDNTNLVSSIGKGMLEYVNQNYQQASEIFKNIQKQSPNLIESKIFLAYNYFQLEKFDIAKTLFKEILSQEQNIQAMTGLAQIYYRQYDFQQYRDLLFQAFKFDQNNHQVLILMIEYFFFKKDYERMYKLANKAIREIEKLPRIEKSSYYSAYHESKSKINFYLGYYHHMKVINQFKESPNALILYKEAILCNPKNFQAQFNLAQIYINEKNYAQALKCMETILQSSYKHKECYRMLGFLYSKNQNRSLSLQFYRQALQFDPQNYEILIEYGNIQEQFDQSDSLQSYEHAEEIMRNQNITIHPELLNNIGVLRTKLGRYESALDSFQKAIYMINISQEKTFQEQAILYTIQFNTANVYEELNQFGQAYEIYRKISNENPYYIDAQLKVAFMNYQRGSHFKAYELIEKAIKIIEINKLRPDMAVCLKSFIQYENGDYTQSFQNLERLKKNFNMDDPFAKVFAAKIEYRNSIEYRQQQQQQFQILRKMIEQGKDLLQKDENNSMGACIIAVVMAELRYNKEAREIFNQLLENNPNNLYFLVNVAHLEFLQHNYQNAIKIYKNYIIKSSQPDEYIMMCLAVCYFQMNDWKNAISNLKKLVMMNPDSLQHRFNLNMIIYKQAQNVLDMKVRQQEDTQQAFGDLQVIQKFYMHFYQNHNARNSRSQLEKSEEGKKRMFVLMERIRDLSENQYNFIEMNQKRYDQLIKEDRQQIYQKQTYSNRFEEALTLIQNKKQLEDLQKKQVKLIFFLILGKRKTNLNRIRIGPKKPRKSTNCKQAQQMALQLMTQQKQQQSQKKTKRVKKEKIRHQSDSSNEQNINDIIHDSEEEKYDFDMKKIDPELQPVIKPKHIKRSIQKENVEEPRKRKLKKLNKFADDENKNEEDLLYNQIYNPVIDGEINPDSLSDL